AGRAACEGEGGAGGGRGRRRPPRIGVALTGTGLPRARLKSLVVTPRLPRPMRASVPVAGDFAGTPVQIRLLAAGFKCLAWQRPALGPPSRSAPPERRGSPQAPRRFEHDRSRVSQRSAQ